MDKLQFLKIVIARFLIILFRRKKGVELLYLEYNTEHLFDNSFIIINYRFRNAIYYKFGNHKTLEKQIKIFNIKNLDKEIELTVYGFFQNKTYLLKFEPHLTLNTQTFKAKISNLNLKLKEQTIPKLVSSNIYVNIDKLIINNPKIKIKTKPINILQNTFNQNDFI